MFYIHLLYVLIYCYFIYFFVLFYFFHRWYKKDGVRLVPVSARPGVILLSGSLYFQQVSVRDSGTYVCVVNNSAGEKRMESSLTVTGNLFSLLKK